MFIAPLIGGVLNSPWAKRVGAVLLLCALGAFLCVREYRRGYREGEGVERARNAKAASEAVALFDTKYRAQEKAHEERVESVRLDFARQQAVAKVEDAKVVSNLQSGIKRLRVAVASCSPNPSSGSSTSSGTNGPGVAELSPEVGAGLYSIASDADQAARILGALQSWANSTIKACNGGK